MGGRPTRWKEYDDVRTVRTTERLDDGTQVVRSIRIPGWVQVEEGHEADVSRRMDDARVGALAKRVDAIQGQMAATGGRHRAARARNTRQRRKMMEDLGGLDPRALAALICSRP